MQDQIRATCQVKIGLAAHHGEFYSLGGGLYGAEADAIEELAENETEGDEIVISQSVHERLPPGHAFRVFKRGDDPNPLGAIYRVLDGPRVSDVAPTDTAYPIPYSHDFYKELVDYEKRLADTSFAKELSERYKKDKVIVLVVPESLGGGDPRGRHVE